MVINGTLNSRMKQINWMEPGERKEGRKKEKRDGREEGGKVGRRKKGITYARRKKGRMDG